VDYYTGSFHCERSTVARVVAVGSTIAGLLMRPGMDEAEAEARKCEAEAKNFM